MCGAGDSKIFELKIPLLKQVTKQNILNTIGRYFQRYAYLFLGAISFIAIMLLGRLGASVEQKDMPTLSISLIGCFFHQDESLFYDGIIIIVREPFCWTDDKTNRLYLFAALTDLSRSLPMQSEALILGIIHYESSVTKIGSKS